MIRFTLFLSLLSLDLYAQTSTEINLIYNGNFEKKNHGFNSEYSYDHTAEPGSYVITSNAAANNPDFKDPLIGDHTKRNGHYLVFNTDGQKGKKFWCSDATVIPNARYEFSAYFCNVYALLPPKTNFALDEGDAKGNDPELKVNIGKDVIAIEKDFYHLFRWIRITGTWYSGIHDGSVEICLENLNRSVSGNDLALDDISFTYIETMPEGYKPPFKANTLVSRTYEAPDTTYKMPLHAYGEFDMTDTVTNGVFVLHAKPWHPIIVPKDSNSFYRVALHNLIFEQTKAELKESVIAELNTLAEWLNRDTAVRIRFIGHTDNQGDPALNIKLSEERVLNVKKYLVSKGIEENRIETIGYGGKYPKADNATEESRKLNRRVEMEILSK